MSKVLLEDIYRKNAERPGNFTHISPQNIEKNMEEDH